MSNRWNKDDWKKCSILTISLCLVVAFYVILGRLPGVLDFLGTIIGAFTPIIMGCVIAFLLMPVMNFLKGVFSKFFIKVLGEEKKMTAVKIANTLAVAFSLIFLLSIIFGLLIVLIPELQKSITMLSNEIPTYIDKAKTWLKNLSFLKKYPNIYETVSNNLDKIQDNLVKIMVNKLLPNIDTIVVKISSGIIGGVKFVFNFFVGIIIAAYILYSKERLSANGKKMIYGVFKKKKGTVVLDSLSFVNNVFGGFIDGKILDSMIIGIICAIFCLCVDMPYAILVSVTVGITNIIPFFGPFIGAVPCALLILVADPIKCLVFVIFILILQQIDGNILGPLILGDSTGLSGLWVMVAILVGGNLFSFMGMLLGVPVFACIYALVNVIIDSKLKKQGLTNNTDYYLTLHGFDEEGNPIRTKRRISSGNDRRSRKQNKKMGNRKPKDIMTTRENIREKVGMNIGDKINDEKAKAIEEMAVVKERAASQYNEYLKKKQNRNNENKTSENKTSENKTGENKTGENKNDKNKSSNVRKNNDQLKINNVSEQNVKRVQNAKPKNHKTNETRNQSGHKNGQKKENGKSETNE